MANPHPTCATSLSDQSSQGPGAAGAPEDEIAGYYRGMFRRELVRFWFRQAYDDLVKKRRKTSKKKTIKVRGRKVQLESGRAAAPPVKSP